MHLHPKGYSKKFNTGRLGSEVTQLNPFVHHFDRRYLFHIPLIQKGYPLHIINTFITSLWIWINHQKRKSSHQFHVLPNKWNGATIRCISSKLLITDWEISLATFSYTSACKIPTPLYIPEAWKWYQFWAEPPVIGHYREYSPPPWNFHLQW